MTDEQRYVNPHNAPGTQHAPPVGQPAPPAQEIDLTQIDPHLQQQAQHAYLAQVFPDVLGQWRWRIVAENGQIVGTSGEGYVNEAHAYLMLRQLFEPGAVTVPVTERTI